MARSLPTTRIFRGRRFSVVYLLVVSMLTGLAYAAWRLYRASASAPRPRVVGPDDDPEFLRRLNNHPDPDTH
jgi:hypothetical protein